jgi:hypothetical protein
MELVFFGAFSVVAAMIYNYVSPKIFAMSWAQTASAKGFVGKTLVTGAAFFVVLVGAGIALGIVTSKSPVKSVV